MKQPPNLLLARAMLEASRSRSGGHLAGPAKLQRSKWHFQRIEPLGPSRGRVARVGSMVPALQASTGAHRSANAGSGGSGLGAGRLGTKPQGPSGCPACASSQQPVSGAKLSTRSPDGAWGGGIFQPNSEPDALLEKSAPKEKGILARELRERGAGAARLYLFSLFCFRDLCRSPMSTTAARIPAFRQCILPAGWDMARRPRVPGRALARPPRAPVGPAPRAPRRPLPAPGRPPRMDPAPPRCAPGVR